MDVTAEYNTVFNLDQVYELDLSKPRIPIICNYLKSPITRSAYWITKSASERMQKYAEIPNLIVLHWWTGWLSKRLPKGKWYDIVERLRDKFYIVEVGWKRDERLGLGEMRYDLSWQDTAALLSHAKVFLGVDSGVMHVALGVGTPTVGFFGPTKPELIFDNPLLHPIMAEGVECLGCYHQPPYPKEVAYCYQPYIYCQQWLKPCNVAKLVFEVAGVPFDGEDES